MADNQVQQGLENITVAETRLSSIDVETGELVIGGFPLDEFTAEATVEETVYLLRHDRLPTADESQHVPPPKWKMAIVLRGLNPTPALLLLVSVFLFGILDALRPRADPRTQRKSVDRVPSMEQRQFIGLELHLQHLLQHYL